MAESHPGHRSVLSQTRALPWANGRPRWLFGSLHVAALVDNVPESRTSFHPERACLYWPKKAKNQDRDHVVELVKYLIGTVMYCLTV